MTWYPSHLSRWSPAAWRTPPPGPPMADRRSRPTATALGARAKPWGCLGWTKNRRFEAWKTTKTGILAREKARFTDLCPISVSLSGIRHTHKDEVDLTVSGQQNKDFSTQKNEFDMTNRQFRNGILYQRIGTLSWTTESNAWRCEVPYGIS